MGIVAIFEIKSVKGDLRVELKAVGRDFVLVTVEGSGLSASTKVAHLGGSDGLSDYWADLSQNWRGWTGEKSWHSLEYDFWLSATSDRTGHVTLKVTLECHSPWTWKTQALVTIEAGQLQRLAANALGFARFLGLPE
jgi:hypothetical protein